MFKEWILEGKKRVRLLGGPKNAFLVLLMCHSMRTTPLTSAIW